MSKHDFRRNFAIIIGINDYQNGIKKLETAKPDAQKLADIIKTQHENLKPQYQAQNKYEVQLLLDQRASLSQLKQLIADFKQGQITLDKEKVAVTESDRLLFYFAGHGIALDALENQEGPVGYLIPQDATSGDSSTYLRMQELHDALNALPCRHMLAILDCCFAGAFRWACLNREVVRKVKVYKERYDRFISDRAWQVITSATDDQKALDSSGIRGIVTDGNEKHSPFAKALFDALLGKGADLNKDGIITATELYSYLREQVEILTEEHYQRQTPSLCPLRKHDKGEFIFLSPDFDRDKLEDAPPLNLENNPYRGLSSYDEKDHKLFFGREKQLKKLYQKVVDKKQQLTLVLGASGTGKSSLVKAGLIPKLRKDDKTWCILPPFRPGESPLESLNNVLESVKQPLVQAGTSSCLFTPAEESLGSWFKSNPQAKLLVVIDQFEELITLSKSEEAKKFQIFIKNSLAKYPNNIHLVITLRLDFEAQFENENSILKDLWNGDARFVVPPMSQNEFREVIEKPALEKVLYFDPPSLVDDLINEVVQMPGALPLLSFTLNELYLKYLSDRTRDNRALIETDYKELGQVVGSLTQRANQEYNKLFAEDSAYEYTVRQVMLRMISLQGGELARRQVLKSELVYSSEKENKRVNKVIECFSTARLIVGGSNSQGKPYVEPAHDALVRGWQELLAWKQKDEESLLLQRRLTPAAEEWSNKRQNSFLWNADPRLDLLKQVLKSKDNWFNQLEAEFVQRSVRKKRQNSIIRWMIAVSFIVGPVIFSALVWTQWRNSQLNLANSLARNSLSLFNKHDELEAFVEAIKAGKILQKQNATDPDVINALQQVVFEGREYNRMERHDKPVRSISISPDGMILASGSEDKNIKLWNLRKGEEIRTLMGHGDYVESVSFSFDGKILASSSDDTTIRLWNPETGDVIHILQGHKNRVTSVSFSPDGKILASGSWDTKIKLWDVKTGKEIRFLQSQPSNNQEWTYRIISISFSPDGKILASGSGDGTIKLWNPETGKVIRILKEFQGQTDGVTSVSFSPDNKTLAGSAGKTIKIWNLETGEVIHTIQGHTSLVYSISFSSNGKILASGSFDQTIKLWSSETGKEINTLKGHDNYVKSVSFSPDGKTLASGSVDKTIKLWDLESREKIRTLKGHNDFVTSVSFSPDGQTLVSGSYDKTIKLWSLETGQQNRILRGHRGWIFSVMFSPDGQLLASSGDSIKVWNLKTGQITRTLQKNPGWIDSVSFSPDGKTLAGSVDNTIKLWDVKTGEKIYTLKGHDREIKSLSFSPDGKILASGGYDFDNTIKLWNVKTGEAIYTLKGHDREVTSLSFNKNRDILASGSTDKTIKLWNPKTGKIIRTLQGNNGGVNSVSFSPNGKILASGSADKTIKLWWNFEMGDENISRQVHDSEVRSISFSPNGKILASSSNDRTIKLWNLDLLTLDTFIERSCDRVRGYLQNNPNVSVSDRHLCDGIGTQER